MTLCLIVVGCGSREQSQTEYRSASWKIEDVTLECGDPSKCPDHQGALIHVQTVSNGYLINRCTASLYQEQRVLSARHCQPDTRGDMYFLSVPKNGQKGRLVRAYLEMGLLNETYDYASFTLAEPITGRSFVQPVPVVPITYPTMVALVVNGISDNRLRLDALDCLNKPNRVSSQTVADDPTTFILEKCTIVKGNSGGAIVRFDNLNFVYGVVSAIPQQDISEAARVKRMQMFGLTNWGIINNARCFELPGWPKMANRCI